jgi:hypothetical protein
MSGTIAYTFTARFAGVELEIETWTEDIGRTVIRHEPTRGAGAQLSDRGQVPRTYNLSIRLTGTAVVVAAKRAALVELRSSQETRVFEHPLDGVVRCKLEALSGSVAAGNVSFSVTLVEDLAFTRRTAAGQPADDISLQDIEITADELLLSLSALQLEDSPDIAGAVEKASTWTERAQSDIVADVEAMRADVLDLRRELDASTDVALFQASIQLEAFRASYERYARAVNDIRGAVFELNVALSLPLIVILTSLYGAGPAESLLDEVARINSVLDVTRVAVGTILSLPSAVQ